MNCAVCVCVTIVALRRCCAPAHTHARAPRPLTKRLISGKQMMSALYAARGKAPDPRKSADFSDLAEVRLCGRSER